MKRSNCLFAVGLIVALSASQALAMGRGGRGGGGRGMRAGPAGGYRSGGYAHGVSTGPYGGVHAGNIHGGSHTGPGGTTIQHVGGSGASRGPLGGAKVGAGSATRVTGPGGNTYTHTSGGSASRGALGGVQVRGGSGTSVRTPYGTGAAIGHRGGVAVGPAGGVRVGSSSGAAVRTQFGTSAIGTRGGVAVGPGGMAVGGRSVAVGHSTRYMRPTTLPAYGYQVRSNFHSNCFTSSWYGVHRTAWIAPRYVVGYNPWRPVAWGACAAFVGIVAPPVSYDYGSSVVIQDNSVYVNGDSVGSADEYAAQATQIVDAGRQAQPAENDEWQPFGVFGLIQEDEKTAQRIFQLAVNKDGIVRGNYYDAVADNTLPVVGSLDKKSQRVAWSIGEKKDIVFETGLANFSKDDSTVLVHYGKENTQQMILVRLEEPGDQK